MLHWIPQSASHAHILVSVFPLVGLIFLLGFYVTSLITKNEGLQRSCLTLFFLLGLVAIPTYLSGDGALDAAMRDPKFSQDLMDDHFGWGLAGLSVLAATALVALIELLRSSRAGRLSENALHLVLGLGLITLLLMAVTGELGWETHHHELDLPTDRTTQIWSHVHIILNHFPTVGFVFTLVLYVTGLITNNTVMKRAGLVAFVICAILGVPTFVTGNASMWAVTERPVQGITKAVINAHRDFAIYTLFGLAFALRFPGAVGGAVLFILALALSTLLDPAVGVLHGAQSLLYIVIAVLIWRRQAWGYGAGVTVAALWNGANLFATGFIAGGLESLWVLLRTGHLSRPALLLVLIGAFGHFLMIAGCLVGFLGTRSEARSWGKFFLGAVLVFLVLAAISPLRHHPIALPLDIPVSRDVVH